MSKKQKVVLSIIIFVILIFVVYSFFIQSSFWVEKQIDTNDKKILTLLKENPIVIEYLENIYYSYDDEILITYEESKLRFFVNEKETSIDSDTSAQLMSVITILNCERIKLYEEESNKILRVLIGYVRINKKDIYSHSLVYSSSKLDGTNIGTEIYPIDNNYFPNWYFRVILLD